MLGKNKLSKRTKQEYISKKWGEILHIFDPIYRQNYYYFNCKTEKNYQKLLKMKFKIDRELKDKDGGCEVYKQTGIDVCFIWSKGKDISVIAHEVFHAVHYVLERKGIKLSDETDESYAYLIQFLMKEILE